MTRSEVSGYVQIVIGAVGIILTVATSPAMLDAFGKISGAGALPTEFSGISGAVRIFSVMFVLFCFALLLIIGLGLVLSPVFRALGSGHPFLTGLFAVLGIVCLAVTVTLAALGINFWITGFLAVLTFVWITFASTAQPGRQGETGAEMATVACIGSILFLIAGAVTVLANSTADDREISRELH